MLEQLFSSKTRVKLLKIFLSQGENRDYYIRELTRLLSEHLNSIRRELENLEDLGLVISSERDKKKYYGINKDFILLPELKALLLKSKELNEQRVVEQIQKISSAELLVLTGTFTGNSDSPVDIFIVGRVQKGKLERIIKAYAKESGRELNYTVMSKREFQERVELGDRFIFTLLNGRKITIINKLGI
jgi:predicted DNA-binding transcriptional regulator YafY